MAIPHNFHESQTRFLLAAALLTFLMSPCSPTVFGASVEGHFRTGLDITRVKLRDEDIDLDEIKSSSLFSNLDLEITQLNEKSDAFIIDIRDRYDFFSKADRQALHLENKNSARVNEIAYHRPWENNRVYFKLGRFDLVDAGIYRHDGLEVGYRLNEFQRISLFGGRAPKDVWISAPRHADDHDPHRQEQGLYWVYEKHGSVSDESVFITNALGQSPSDDWVKHDSRTYIYHSSQFQLGPRHRISNQINLDLTPISIIRQAYLTYQYLNAIYQFTSFYNRIAADDYRLARDIQEKLQPSKLDMTGLSLIQQVGQDVSFEYKLEASRRSVDALQRKLLAFGTRYRGFSHGRFALGGLAGIRDDFLSKDNFLELQLDAFQQHINLHIEQEFSRRKYKDADIKLNQSRSLLELAFYFNEQWQGSTAWILTHHSRADINTFYLMIGYSFAGSATAPPPVMAPYFKEW